MGVGVVYNSGTVIFYMAIETILSCKTTFFFVLQIEVFWESVLLQMTCYVMGSFREYIRHVIVAEFR